MQEIKIQGYKPTDIHINGERIHGVTSVDFRVSVDELPHFHITTLGFPDIAMNGDITFNIAPESVLEAVKIIQEAYMQDEEIRKGFRASVLSALKDAKYMTLKEAAKHITDLVMGCHT